MAADVSYYTSPPPKTLREHVRFFWVLESRQIKQPYIHRSMADSCTEILFHYKGTFDELDGNNNQTASFTSGIHSQTNRYRRFTISDKFGIFGAYLYPFASRQLLNLSPAELTNEMPDLHSALGKAGKELEERIFHAADNHERVRILSAFLESRLCHNFEKPHPARSAVKYIIQSKNLHKVRDLAERFNLSERQLERKFKEFSGFSPKLCMRIVRFEMACSRYGNSGKKTLTEIAHECGYYDQSHFIHDFKEFSGYEPHRYFSGKAEGIEWREQ